MRVKIGDRDTIYDPGETPIIVQLTPDDKARIAAMPPEDDIWASHPVNYPRVALEKFMRSMPPHPEPALVPLPTDVDRAVQSMSAEVTEQMVVLATEPPSFDGEIVEDPARFERLLDDALAEPEEPAAPPITVMVDPGQTPEPRTTRMVERLVNDATGVPIHLAEPDLGVVEPRSPAQHNTLSPGWGENSIKGEEPSRESWEEFGAGMDAEIDRKVTDTPDFADSVKAVTEVLKQAGLDSDDYGSWKLAGKAVDDHYGHYAPTDITEADMAQVEAYSEPVDRDLSGSD
jgi:hypothetical protein